MPNKTLMATIATSYTDNAGTKRTPSLTNSAQYTASAEGTVDVPDTTAGDTEFVVPFGSVAKATFFEIRNSTGQPLTLALNGGDPLIDIPDGGTFTYSANTTPAANPLTAATLTTTASQEGGGAIAFWVFGDPV